MIRGNPLNESPGRKVRAFLFADAEVGEDVAEDVVGVDRTCDFAEVVQGLAGVHGDEVAWHVVGQTLAHRLNAAWAAVNASK